VALGDDSLAALLERTAARTPAPGGGSAAAVTAAIAAALTEMAASYAHDAAATASRARALRASLLELAEQDTASYAPVLEALALETSDPRRPAAVARALSDAAHVPTQIVEQAAEVARLAGGCAAAAGPHLAGDAAAATVLAEAAAASAGALVALNLAGSGGDPRVLEAAARVREAGEQRELALALTRSSTLR